MDQRRRLLPWAVLAVTVGLAATYSIASAFPPATLPWLSKDGLYSPSEAEQYYATIGAPAVFADWLFNYGFLSNADEVKAIYYNGGDLGFGREMHCREQPGSYVACYVANHGLGPAGPPAAAVDDAVFLRNDLGTVAMVYSPAAITNTVRFYIYDTGGTLAPNLPRLTGVPLDSQGVKNGPSMCLACHGGYYDTASNTVSDAKFLPFDVESFKYSPQPGYRLADQQEAFRQLNRLVLHTNPTPLIQELITKWYAGTGGIDQEGAVINPTVVANAYNGNDTDRALYNDVVKPYCRTCHVAQTFWVSDPGQFSTSSTTYWNDIYRDFVMPHAELTSHNFWSGRAPIELANNRGWAARVTKTADTFDGTCNADCSLRDAVTWANTHGGGPVTFDVDGTFTLSAGELVINQRVVILGNGANRTILDGGGAGRVLHLQGATANLLLRGVTIQNGLTTGQGGGVLNEGGQLYLDASVVRNNVSTKDGFWGGGGVASTNTYGTPTLEITNSTIGPGNQAETSDGGGILNLGGVMTVTNTTISGNRAEVGGGLFTQGGSSQAFVTHSTLTLNHATQTAGGLISFDHLRLRNSLVAGNTADGVGYRNCVAVSGANVVLQGRNLLGLTGNCPNNPADLIWPGRVSDLLNTGLAADSRGVGYHALLPASAAVDTLPTGASAACSLPTYDQRGLARPLRGRDSATCDIGAHEFLSITVSSTADTVADDGVCTLREAITAANTGALASSNPGECPPHVDWIELVGQAQYHLTGAPLVVRTGLTINGHGATVRRTGGTGRLFDVAGGGNLSLLNLTLRNGSQTGSGNGGSGGALLVQPGGTANVLGSAILNNTTESWGGGIANMGTLNLANSTVSGNSANVDSGGVDNTGTATLVNVTITNNTANADGLADGEGGGLGAFGGAVTVKGSLIAGNFDAGAPSFPDVFDAGDPTSAASAGPSAEALTPDDQARRNAAGPNAVQALYLASADFNVVGDGTGAASAFSQPDDRVGTGAAPLDPRLGPLTGSPAYHPLLAGSPALDRIPAFDCTYLSAALGNPLYQAGDNLTADQRGELRPLSATGSFACDAGAFEFRIQVFVPLVRR